MTEVVQGDVLDPASLDRALEGIDVAYYLVHSMGAHGDYHEKDRLAARNFGEAARRTGVRRIVYLGGLANDASGLSRHLILTKANPSVRDRNTVAPMVTPATTALLKKKRTNFPPIQART